MTHGGQVRAWSSSWFLEETKVYDYTDGKELITEWRAEGVGQATASFCWLLVVSAEALPLVALNLQEHWRGDCETGNLISARQISIFSGKELYEDETEHVARLMPSNAVKTK